MSLLSREKNEHDHDWGIKECVPWFSQEMSEEGMEIVRAIPQNRVCTECGEVEPHDPASKERMFIPWERLGEWEDITDTEPQES